MAREKIRDAIETIGRAEENAAATAKKEVLNFLTELIRDEEETDIQTRMKAAELLGKQASLFEKETEKTETSRIVIVDDIP